MLAALHRLGTISAVAAELHLTAPGVSMQLSAFEREVGLPLTRRQGRRVVLTSAGRALAAHGHDILGRLSAAELEIDALRSGSVGQYAVTAFPSAARTIIADVCRRIYSDPDGGLDLTVGTSEPEDAVAALTAGLFDLAVVHSYSNVARDLPTGVVGTPLGTEPVWLAVRSDDGRRRIGTSAPLVDYSESRWITPTPGVSCFSMVERACGLAGFRPRVVAETMDFGVQLELVAAGVGVALVPALTIDRLPDGVELLDLASPVERSLLLAVREPNTSDPGVRTLSRIIRETARDRLALLDRVQFKH